MFCQTFSAIFVENKKTIKESVFMEKTKEKIVDLFIDEKSYQQIKIKMCKSDDYFTLSECYKLRSCGYANYGDSDF